MSGPVADSAGLTEAVDSAMMMENLSRLAAWKKLAGTAEEAESLRFIQDRMASYGYRTEMLWHDAFISLPGSAGVWADGVAIPAITHAMSLPSGEGGVSGRLVAVGTGTEADFEGKDLAGAILLVHGIASPAVSRRATTAGAVAQLHVSPREQLHEMCVSPVWGNPSAETMAELPRTVVVTISRADGEALAARLAAGGAPAVRLEAQVDTGWRQTPILVAELDAPDADAAAPFILFSGHHDTWYEGVMDNGAANATMMEVARVLAGHRPAWRRHLRFCFWSGHSQGRYSGSAWYADRFWAELEARCAVHVNVDSTGAQGATVLDQAPSSRELAALAAEVLVEEAGVTPAGKRMGRNADQSFWGIGIPSIFSTFSEQPGGPGGARNALGWWWHTPHDLLDKIDPAHLRRDTRVYTRLVWRLLTDERLPFDHAAQLEELLGELRACQSPLSDGAGLGDLISTAEALCQRARAVRLDDATAMRMCRLLVPMDYTEGDRFRHDPALPQPPWPALAPLRALCRAQPGGDAAYVQAVSARRACNRLGSTLRAVALLLG